MADNFKKKEAPIKVKKSVTSFDLQINNSRNKHNIEKDLMDFLVKNADVIQKKMGKNSPQIYSLYKNLTKIEDFEFKARFTESLVLRYIEHLEKRESCFQYFIEHASKAVEISTMNLFQPNGKKERFLNPAKKESTYFTSWTMSEHMAKKTIKPKGKKKLEILDPSGGVGILSFALLKEIEQKSPLLSINLTIVEKNETIFLYLKKISKHFSKKFLKKNTKIRLINKDFLDFIEEAPKEKFDLIVMNPPYGRMRALKNISLRKETLLVDKHSTVYKKNKKEVNKQVDKIRRKFSEEIIREGIIDIAETFVSINMSMLKPGGGLTAIFPDSWTANKQSKNFRKRLLEDFYIRDIEFIKENKKIFQTVNQSLCILSLKNSPPSKTFNVCFEDRKHKNLVFKVKPRDIILKEKNYRIPRINPKNIPLISFLEKFKKLSEQERVKNIRGEVDLSKAKPFLSFSKGMKIVRGDSVFRSNFNREKSKKEGFLDIKYIESIVSKNKQEYKSKSRICIRQSSYMNQEHRLIACIIPKDFYVSNSCNFISCDNGKNYNAILAILLSSQTDIIFRSTNSNNHVSNYELDEIILGNIYSKEFAKLETSANRLFKRKNWSQKDLDLLVLSYFNIPKKIIEDSTIKEYWTND